MKPVVVRITLLECVMYKLKGTLKKGRHEGIEVYEKDKKKIYERGYSVAHACGLMADNDDFDGGGGGGGSSSSSSSSSSK
jgi:hypothetical protein